MSEAEKIEIVPAEPFEAEVWRTLSQIDVSEHLKQLKLSAKVTLSYLSWARAWGILMTHYPASHYEFDPPAMFSNETGEQWVTVTISDGVRSMTRRWWLPYMTTGNQPVKDPTSTQINNTRMRVLVKALATCGLGYTVYAGEDVPSEEMDAAPVSSVQRRSTSVAAAVMEEAGVDIDEAKRDEYVSELRRAMPSQDEIEYRAMAELAIELSEPPKRKKGMTDSEYAGAREAHQHLAIAVGQKLESWQKGEMRKAVQAHREQLRKAAVEEITGKQDEDRPG